MRNAAETPNIVAPAASMTKFQILSCPCGQKYRCRTTLADVYDDRAIAMLSSFFRRQNWSTLSGAQGSRKPGVD